MNENTVLLDKEKLKTIYNFCKIISNTKLVPEKYRKDINTIFGIVVYGIDLGISWAQALKDINIIHGKLTINGDLALALVQAHRDCEDVKEYFEDEEETIAICEVKRKNRSVTIRKFTLQNAKIAGLLDKKDNFGWRDYQQRMLQYRARGFALRDAFPDALKGLITSEEAEDYIDIDTNKVEGDPDDNIKLPLITNDQSDDNYNENDIENEEIIEEKKDDQISLESYITTIQKFIDNHNLEDRVLKYISTRFNKSSLEDLTIKQLEEVYLKILEVLDAARNNNE